MVTKKIPLRMCIVCKKELPKKELDRIVKTDDGFVLDKTGKMNGRGSYICKDEECIKKLFKQKVLNKVFKTNITEENYSNLKEQFFGEKN